MAVRRRRRQRNSQRKGQVRRTLAHKLVGYALGRTLQLSDRPLIDSLSTAGNDAGFTRLAGEIVTSKQFRNRAPQVEVTQVGKR